LVSKSSRSRLTEIDWDFTGDYSESPFSAVHWHPGRFASQIPAALISSLTGRGDLVIDPFVGSGTTLVEAQRLGRRGFGIDLNPVSCLIAQAKTLAASSTEVEGAVREIQRRLQGRQEVFLEDNRAFVPTTVQAAKWYSPGVRRQLAGLWRLIVDFDEPLMGMLGRFGFSAILLEVCRETRHWGYVCDNTEPKGHREAEVLARCVASLDRLVEAYRLRDNELRDRRRGSVVPALIVAGDARVRLRDLAASSAKLVVTSPPYFGVCDYIKAQRLAFEWFGLPLEEHRLLETGARSKRHRRDARCEYLNELCDALELAVTALERGGRLALVVGESAERDSVVGELVRKLQKRCSLEVEFQTDRFISVQRRQAPSIRRELIVVLKKGERAHGNAGRLG